MFLRKPYGTFLVCTHLGAIWTSAAHVPGTSSEATNTCEHRSINYIDPGLPLLCHRHLGAPTTYPHETGSLITTAVSGTAVSRTIDDVESSSSLLGKLDSLGSPIPPKTFVSFDDWKDQKAREVEQEAQFDEQAREARSKGPSGQAVDVEDTTVPREEADLYMTTSTVVAGAPWSSELPDDRSSEPVVYNNGKPQQYRSKDAGKTCKERFSYSSFDAGATVLKTNEGAKNAKAILVENKDSYMLLECSAANKFVIVELTDDILIDTVVLANFEFFSSMVRHFRVSASGRYPVKLDKWTSLGTFEAKNSRDIQPFLIPNPLIWAKYVRIEFLSHYGNEYYCPVSLLRIHGTRMLDSWIDTEVSPDDEEMDQPEINDEIVSPSLPDNADVKAGQHNDGGLFMVNNGTVPMFSPNNASATAALFWLWPRNGYDTCAMVQAVDSFGISAATSHLNPETSRGEMEASTWAGLSTGKHADTKPGAVPIAITDTRESSELQTDATQITPSSATATVAVNEERSSRSAIVTESTTAQSSPSPNRAGSHGGPGVKARNGTTSSPAPPSPTVQESFHKAVSKRLQLLETNVTLSLRYLEDQSRILQESQHESERNQMARVDSFLDNINRTLMSDLRSIRQQYDQVWQSTVIALESQREQSQREILALGSRLNILADEVVFQKRMAILQAVLLLCCLLLVVFSRVPIHASSVPPLSLAPTPYVRARAAIRARGRLGRQSDVYDGHYDPHDAYQTRQSRAHSPSPSKTSIKNHGERATQGYREKAQDSLDAIYEDISIDDLPETAQVSGLEADFGLPSTAGLVSQGVLDSLPSTQPLTLEARPCRGLPSPTPSDSTVESTVHPPGHGDEPRSDLELLPASTVVDGRPTAQSP